MPTLEGIAADVETKLSMTSGVEVQIYGRPRIFRMIQDQFELLFDKVWWDDYYNTATYTLDGATGLINEDVSEDVQRFTDFYAFWYATDKDPLPRLPRNVNALAVQRRCVAPHSDPTKLFRIYPMDTEGSITVGYRSRPANFVETEAAGTDASEININMDRLLLTAAVMHMFLVEDGANPDAAMMYKAMMDARYNDMRNAQVFLELATDGYGSNPDFYTEWWG